MRQEKPLISLTGITKTYPEGDRKRFVFNDASLTVTRGEWLFLLGRSGSGKSTLLNLVSGIDLPDRGEVEVDGRNLTRMPERERTIFRRSKIGFIFQFFNLVPTLTVMENVLLPLELNGRLGKPERDRAAELLRAVGLEERGGAYPELLSGGEQQRIAVARALVHRPLLVLADEPTGNLDRESADNIMALFDGLVRSAGATLILVTHSNEIARHADRRLAIRDGVFSEIPAGKEFGA